MLITNTNIVINGKSTITENDGVKEIARFSGSINESGEINVNKYVTNRKTYNANKATVNQDYNDFEDFVGKLADTVDLSGTSEETE